MEEQFSVDEILIMSETDPKKAAELMEEARTMEIRQLSSRSGNFIITELELKKTVKRA